MPGMQELIVIFIIIVLLFGAKKIPDLAKGFGLGIKNFKKAVKEDDENESKAKEIKADAENTKDSSEVVKEIDSNAKDETKNS